MTDPIARHEALLELLRERVPGFRLAFKDDPTDTIPWHHRVAHRVAGWVVPQYRTRYTTVLAPIVYLPAGQRESYDANPESWYETLRHELIHLTDARRHPFWMPLSYVLCLPLFVTMRAYWELRGYTQTMLVYHEDGHTLSDHYIEKLTDIFSGRGYLFMLWPRPLARAMLRRMRDRILATDAVGIDADVRFRRDFASPIWAAIWKGEGRKKT